MTSQSTHDQIAGLDTRSFLVVLASDNSTALPRTPPLLAATTARPRLLRLSKFAGTLRTEILMRPSFRNYYQVGAACEHTAVVYDCLLITASANASTALAVCQHALVERTRPVPWYRCFLCSQKQYVAGPQTTDVMACALLTGRGWC